MRALPVSGEHLENLQTLEMEAQGFVLPFQGFKDSRCLIQGLLQKTPNPEPWFCKVLGVFIEQHAPEAVIASVGSV